MVKELLTSHSNMRMKVIMELNINWIRGKRYMCGIKSKGEKGVDYMLKTIITTPQGKEVISGV